MSDKKPDSRPNVLLITTDHWSGRLLGIADHPCILTPTLDQIARNGVRFTNAYTECPVCIPARRTLMTGTLSATHGDNSNRDTDIRTLGLRWLPECFRDAGYQTGAVGKLHIYPQRMRIGFGDVLLMEEGRCQFGVTDDYEIFLSDKGYAGQMFENGMSNNDYVWRPWQLPEETHSTNWIAKQTSRMIQRREPGKPAFWYMAFNHPHPPLWPLNDYLDMYPESEMDEPFVADWAKDPDSLPRPLQTRRYGNPVVSPDQTRAIRLARRAFYALCTHIDHQIRYVLGTLREEGLADNTIVMFTADHGDNLGNHQFWGKCNFHDYSANIPMLLSAPKNERVGQLRTDERVVGLADVMPTLLEMCGIPVPNAVEGLSMIGDTKRDCVYGEYGNSPGDACRMIRTERWKLIYYPAGNRTQLFDMVDDRAEMSNVADLPQNASVVAELTAQLIKSFSKTDGEKYVSNGILRGVPDERFSPRADYRLQSQRGSHYPPPKAVW
ncbi:MAG: sulfatase-like hydrolase/transferase [Planctomycetota bacterium]